MASVERDDYIRLKEDLAFARSKWVNGDGPALDMRLTAAALQTAWNRIAEDNREHLETPEEVLARLR